MKAYKLTFTCKSVINQIPDSQTLFGFICNTIKHLKGEKYLLEYLSSFDDEPMFVHSSMFCDCLLPMIKRNIFSLGFTNEMINKMQKEDKIKTLDNLKKFKRINYISEKIYNNFILNMDIEGLKNEILNNPIKFDVDNNVLRYKDENISFHSAKTILNTRNGFVEEGNDKTLFYTKQYYYPKDSRFCIYVKTNLHIDLVVEIFKYLEVFGIGNRKSVGMNCFKFEKVEECNLNSSKNNKLILSKYIPDEEINYEKSCYQCVSNMYNSMSYSKGSNQMVGKFTHILEGSVMYMEKDKEYYGTIIKIGEKTPIYHYGIGFTF